METPAPPRGTEEERPLLAKVAAGLALLTFLIFLPVVEYEFVNYDDDVFVTNNPKVAPGFTWEGVKWAFTSADIDYWRPLSWLSHMLDIELAGSVAGFHHLSNLVIHVAAVVLCFLALHRLTGAVWRSAMVAALFAWHPLHVESVAWIAERKDVLCGLFFWLTIWSYAGYVRDPRPGTYLRCAVAFLLGLMSKPMMVTTPCVLLLLDFWPLRRVRSPFSLQANWPLLREKLPMFAAVLALGLCTVWSQHQVGTLAKLDALSMRERLINALAAYGRYLTQTFFPSDLCVHYPLWPDLSPAKWAGAAAMLLLISGVSLLRARHQPWILVGWLWFLGMLAPVIGLIQVGGQSHADRYTYLPLCGLFLGLVWEGATRFFGGAFWQRCGLIVCTALVLGACGWLTRAQLAHWQNGITLFQHALSVTGDNPVAHNNLGSALRERGRAEEALPHFQEALRLNPHLAHHHLNVGFSLLESGRHAEAVPVFRTAFTLAPNGGEVAAALPLLESRGRDSLHPVFPRLVADLHAARGQKEVALSVIMEAAQRWPDDLDLAVDVARHLAGCGRSKEAEARLRAVLTRTPASFAARVELASQLSKRGELAEADSHYAAALEQQPANFYLRHARAVGLILQQRWEQGREECEMILRQQPEFWPAMQQLAWLFAVSPAHRNPPRALQLVNTALRLAGSRSADLLDTLAAAQAAAGDFARATATAGEALRRARAERAGDLEAKIAMRLAAYQAGRLDLASPQ